jgi:hypothetical protein
MKYKITRVGWVIGFAIAALLVLSFQQVNTSLQVANAFAEDGRDFLIWQRTVGPTATQTVRISVANLKPSNGYPVSWRCVLFDQEGFVVFTSPTQLVQVGHFNFVDISYSDVNVAPEAGSGRKQVMLQVIEIRERRNSSDISGAVEIINEDGTTASYEPFGN